MSRDPRIDPKAGDSTRYPGGATYVIQDVRDGFVYYHSSEEGSDHIHLSDWREIAAQDEVLFVSPGEVE